MANEHVQEIGLRFKADGSVDYINTLKEISNEHGRLYAEYLRETNMMDKNATATEKLTAKKKLLEDTIENQREKVLVLTRQLESMTSAEEKDEAAISKKRKELAYAEASLAGYEKQLKSTTGELKKHSEWTDKVGKSLQDAGSKMESAGKKLKWVSAGAAAGLTLAGKAAIDFESAFAGVKKTVAATPEEFAKLSAAIKEMAERIPMSTTALAGIMEMGGQLGVPTEHLVAFTEAIAALSVSTNLTEEAAAMMFAQFANITKMDYANFDRLGSVLVQLGNNFAATESSIMEMSMRLAGAGTQIGLSQSEILSLATVLSSVGIRAEMGGSAFSKLMIQMQVAAETGTAANKVIDATGMTLRELQMLADANKDEFKAVAQSLGYTSDEFKKLMKASQSLQDFSDVSGVTAEQFTKNYGQDAPGAILAFLQGLAGLDEEGQSAIVTLNDMGMNEVRLRDTTLRSVNAVELYTEALQMGSEAWEENIAMTNEAEQRYGTTESKLEMLKNQVNNLAIGFGDILLPIIQSVVEWVSGLVGWLQNMDEGTMKVVLAVLAFVAALSPLLIWIGKLTAGLGSIITHGPQIVGMFGSIGTGFKALMALIAANPVIAIVTGIIAVIVLLYTKCEWFRDGVKAVIEAVTNVLKGVADFLKGVFQESWTAVSAKIVEVFTGLLGSVKDIWENIKGVFTGVIDFVKNVFAGNWKGAWQAVIDTFGNVFGMIGNIAKAPINAVISLINGVIDGINQLSIYIPDWIPFVGGQSIGFSIPKIPLLAAGGSLLNGMAIVAEAGPELIRQQGGQTTVIPLSPHSKTGALTDMGLSDETITKLSVAMVSALRQAGLGEASIYYDQREVARMVRGALA